MKARPRRVENQVATEINKYLATYDLPEVERIPVLGRTGPDITLWPSFNVAVDVKSRKANPKGYMVSSGTIRYWWAYGDHGFGECYGSANSMLGVQLKDLDLLFDIENPILSINRAASKRVDKWLSHMLEWCTEQERKKNYYCLPALVLHWPGTPIKNSTFIIYDEDRRALDDRRRERINNLRFCTSDE